MAGFPLPLLKWREDDNNGYPLAGGKLWSYVAGTNTPQATYSDPDLATGHQNTNPVILDASGRANIYIQDGVGYKYVLTDALGNTIYTVDNIFVGGSGGSAPPSGGGGGGGGSGLPPGTTYIVGQVPVTDPPRTSPITFPAGVLFPFVGATAPQGPNAGVPPYDWLLCDGSPVGRSTYSVLFTVIGTGYGSGNGTTTFNLPDLRQKFPLGLLTTSGAKLGDTGGFFQHTHTAPSHIHQLKDHVHGMTHLHTVHHDGWSQQLNVYPNVQQGVLQCGGLNTAQETQVTQANADQNTANYTGNSGPPVRDGVWQSQTETGGGADTTGNDPPYQIFNYLIKT